MMEKRLKLTFLENLFLCLCLLTGLGQANGSVVVRVREGSEAVLPCFIRPEKNIERDAFEWRKVGQMVFLYKNSLHSNNGLPGQDEQFKDRVSHFPERLQFSDASIRIKDTKESDSGTYTCDFSPDDFNRQTFYIDLVVVSVVVKVTEGSDADLPCFIRPKKNIADQYFNWRKVVQKDVNQEVFECDKGTQVTSSQDEQFRGRISHFPEQLQFGDASIRINNTRVSDSGNYTCDFPRLQPKGQIFFIKLVVDCIIKDRWEENIRGASPQPCITLLEQTDDEAKLQCDVRRVFPKPKVKWQDSSGKILPAKEPQVIKRGGSYDIILKTTVTETGDYRCVVTQEEICHQISAVASVYIHDSDTWLLVAVFLLLLVLFLVLILSICCKKVASPPDIMTGEASELFVTTFKTDDGILLQCVVQGASPKPEVELKDSSGNILCAEEPQITEKGGKYYIILNRTVTENGRYHCVVTQEGINHQVSKEISVKIPVITDPEPPEGEASKLSVRIFKTKDGALLRCVVQGASPKPKVEWQNSSGKILPVKEPQVTEGGGKYYITLNTTVTKTGNYQCVVTQKEINHQTKAEIYVFIPGAWGGFKRWFCWLWRSFCNHCKKNSQMETNGDENSPESVELNRNHDTSAV